MSENSTSVMHQYFNVTVFGAIVCSPFSLFHYTATMPFDLGILMHDLSLQISLNSWHFSTIVNFFLKSKYTAFTSKLFIFSDFSDGSNSCRFGGIPGTTNEGRIPYSQNHPISVFLQELPSLQARSFQDNRAQHCLQTHVSWHIISLQLPDNIFTHGKH